MPFFERLAQLERDHASFAVATVVARRSPVSSHLGDRALIFADGHMEGFVGGSCSRDIVRRHAVSAIRRGQPVLLQIRPDSRGEADTASIQTAGAHTDLVVIPMSCASEGAVDVYIEPRVPLRRLVIVGFTPVAEALAQVAVALDYAVVRVVIDDELRDISLAPGTVDADRGFNAREDPASQHATRGIRIVELKALRAFLAGLDADTERDLVAVVASQGHYDELALEALLERPIAFIGLLASRRRAEIVAGVLAQQGLAADRIAAIRNPVGLDIGARSPGEVAVSILAQIIAHGKHLAADARPGEAPEERDLMTSATPEGESVVPGRRFAMARRPVRAPGNHHHTANLAPANEIAERLPAGAGGSPDAPFGKIEIDPVCGMDVETANALYHHEHAEQTYFFCGARCRVSFSADPEHYLVPLGTP